MLRKLIKLLKVGLGYGGDPDDAHPERLAVLPYCVGKGIDVGCGYRKTTPDCIGIDILAKGQWGKYGCMRRKRSVADIQTSGDNLYMFGDGELDYVISRHNLEHYVDVVKALEEWKRVLKKKHLGSYFARRDQSQYDSTRPHA